MGTSSKILAAYAALVATELVGHLFDLNIQHFSKPLLMPVLLAYFFVESKKRDKLFSIIVAALILSWLGDSLLMYEEKNELYFIAGLVAFLLAHVGYILANNYAKWTTPKNPLLSSQKLRHSSTLVLAGVALIYVLEPGLGDMKLPVVIYATVLVTMTIMALLRYGYTNISSFGLAFGGAICFMISDSLLAVNKFLTPIPASGFWIMLTYCLAQFLLVKGFLAHQE